MLLNLLGGLSWLLSRGDGGGSRRAVHTSKAHAVVALGSKTCGSWQATAASKTLGSVNINQRIGLLASVVQALVSELEMEDLVYVKREIEQRLEVAGTGRRAGGGSYPEGF